MEEIRYTTAELGKKKLIYKGYMFTFHRRNKTGQVWRCDDRQNCGVTISITDQEEILCEPNHRNHTPDWGRVQAKECVEDMKELARTSREPTSSVVQRSVQSVSSEANLKLPKKATLKRKVQEVRREFLPEEPRTLRELNEIDHRFTKSSRNERWLLRFVSEGNERMAVFATDADLKYLQRAPYWIMDGTLKSAPKIYTQLYTIHVPIRSQWFPVDFVLMENKTKKKS